MGDNALLVTDGGIWTANLRKGLLLTFGIPLEEGDKGEPILAYEDGARRIKEVDACNPLLRGVSGGEGTLWARSLDGLLTTSFELPLLLKAEKLKELDGDNSDEVLTGGLPEEIFEIGGVDR